MQEDNKVLEAEINRCHAHIQRLKDEQRQAKNHEKQIAAQQQKIYNLREEKQTQQIMLDMQR